MEFVRLIFPPSGKYCLLSKLPIGTDLVLVQKRFQCADPGGIQIVYP